jgi:hypothetical protein
MNYQQLNIIGKRCILTPNKRGEGNDANYMGTGMALAGELKGSDTLEAFAERMKAKRGEPKERKTQIKWSKVDKSLKGTTKIV